YESAASAVRFPIDVQPWSAIGIGQGYSRHGMGQLRERRIEGYLVTAEMIFVINRTRLHGSELPGSQQRYSMTLRIDRQFHRSRNYLLGVPQKFTTHLVRECNQRILLLLSGLVVHKQDGPRRIGIRIR